MNLKNIKKVTLFDFPQASTKDINFIIKSLNPKEAIAPDCIPIKVIRTSANVISSHLVNTVNKELKDKKFPDIIFDLSNVSYLDSSSIGYMIKLQKKLRVNDKDVIIVCEKEDRNKAKNYRPVSLPNGLSKIYETFFYNSLTNFTDKIFSWYISDCKKTSSSNHVLIRLTKAWKKPLDIKNIVEVVLMDFSKTFDYIPCNLLVAKLHAYGFSKNF